MYKNLLKLLFNVSSNNQTNRAAISSHLQGFALWFDVVFPTQNSAGLPALKATADTTEKQQPQQHQQPQDGGDVGNGDLKHLTNGNSNHHNNHHNNISSSNNNHHHHNNNNSGDALLPAVKLSTSPYKPETHWKQSIVYLMEAQRVHQDTEVVVSMKLSPNSTNKRFLDIEMKCRVGADGAESHQKLLMGYEK